LPAQEPERVTLFLPKFSQEVNSLIDVLSKERERKTEKSAGSAEISRIGEQTNRIKSDISDLSIIRNTDLADLADFSVKITR